MGKLAPERVGRVTFWTWTQLVGTTALVFSAYMGRFKLLGILVKHHFDLRGDVLDIAALYRATYYVPYATAFNFVCTHLFPCWDVKPTPAILNAIALLWLGMNASALEATIRSRGALLLDPLRATAVAFPNPWVQLDAKYEAGGGFFNRVVRFTRSTEGMIAFFVVGAITYEIALYLIWQHYVAPLPASATFWQRLQRDAPYFYSFEFFQLLFVLLVLSIVSAPRGKGPDDESGSGFWTTSSMVLLWLNLLAFGPFIIGTMLVCLLSVLLFFVMTSPFLVWRSFSLMSIVFVALLGADWLIQHHVI